nr:phosphoglycerate dehydrogenase [uncultured Cohaesibacter sp.]
MKRVLVSNIMMLKEKPRFDTELKAIGYEPVWADVSQFLTEADCLKLVGDIDGWLAGDDKITHKVFEKAGPRLKVIAKWGTGIDSIDREAAKEFDVPVLNSPGAFANTVAEVAIHYMLSLARSLVTIDRSIRRNEWPKFQGIELGSAKVGVIGFGAIGRRIGQLSSCFGSEVHFYDPMVKEVISFNGKDMTPSSLDDIAQNSDFVCLACNYSQESHHMIGAEFLEKMKPSAFLVNVARGPLVDETALVAALEAKKIAGAGLDVFEQEPLPADSKFRSMENVVLGSHNANNSLTAVEYVHANTLKNLQSILG